MDLLERDQTFYRPKSQDSSVFSDVTRQLKDALGGPGERVLDIGCHIAYYSVLARRAGSEVVAVDCDSEIFAVAVHNGRRHGFRVMLAAVGPSDGVCDVFPSSTGKFHNQLTSTVSRRGRPNAGPVEMIDFRRLLDEVSPTILKVDIEGAEHGLDWSELPQQIHTVALELHTPRKEWTLGTVAIRNCMVDQGFGLIHSTISPFRWETTWRRGSAKMAPDPTTDIDFVEINVEWIKRMRRWRNGPSEECAHEDVFA